MGELVWGEVMCAVVGVVDEMEGAGKGEWGMGVRGGVEVEGEGGRVRDAGVEELREMGMVG